MVKRVYTVSDDGQEKSQNISAVNLNKSAVSSTNI